MNYYFITGTSSGLGKALAEALLEDANNTVIGVSRRQTIDHDRYAHVTLDLGNLSEVQAELPGLFFRVKDAERLVLINNAGTLGQVGYVGSLDNAALMQAFHVNITSVALLTNEFIRRYGHVDAPKTVINISSGAGQKPTDGWSAYCATKAALDMFSRVIDEEVQRSRMNLRIFSVAPGIVDTEMQSELRDTAPEGFSRHAQFVAYKSEGQLVSPEAVAQKYLYLLAHEDQFEDVVLSVRNF
ncbi:benzil reductase ((S)-benzoin forming) [Catalinimonas alkaloidigena]|uniref:Benzil reductase ((S)-benzoin forming) n=1 Tax=Catalinimonas alkaloidigena TaxID=1075417 RepID=A0A1G9QPI9_9BACT|nr:SDR family NAD(P)-dependent oxidoreductase [Catalinimonas alkaloidigena]SDM12924.1 benzil reductase ((S)-benzoin forming) [Catalinimonas alkaloidigena]